VLNDWQTLNLNSAYNMFKNASSFNQPLDAWDVSNLNDFEGMFDGATSFNQSLDNWDFSNAVYINDFVNNSGLNVSNYDDLLLKLASFFIENVQFGAGGLQYCDTVARSHLINELGWQILGDTIYSGCNIIEGMVYYDYDSNGCMSSTYNVNNVFVQIGGNGLTINALVNESSYSVPVVDSGLEVSIPNLPDYFSVLPESVTVYFDGNNEEQIDFCLTANQSIEDINITILPIDEARPGFEANYLLVIENIGTQTVNNVSATLIFDDTMQSFVSANPAPVANTASTLDFNIASLAPNCTFSIKKLANFNNRSS